MVGQLPKIAKLVNFASFDNLFVFLPDGKLHEQKGIHWQTTVL